ncbi:hypothetical protein CRYUN_Cryun15aG0136700 [Craigia yunnanensis]
MQTECVKPGNLALASTLSACSYLEALDQGRWIHAYIDQKRIEIDPILGCVLNRHFMAVEEKRLTGLVICKSYSGLVDEGKSLFDTIGRVHKLSPTTEHYGCMVDLLGRAGFMEILIEEDLDYGGRYIHLANIHAAVGDWDQAVEERRQMKERGVSKLPGCSAISLNGVVHEFLAGGLSHPQTADIYRMWNNIAERLEKEGYKPALQNLLLDLKDEAKEMAINQHSKKLAIAFGLLKTKPGTTIRIVKNLRVC